MQIHGSCVARDGAGVLLLGPSGCGKSDLVLRLLECGFVLVADDRVIVEAGMARAPDALLGLLEIRGLGILRLPYVHTVRLALAVELGLPERLPMPRQMNGVDLPLVTVDPAMASAPLRVARALDCALGLTPQIAGAFAP
jgi:HPr kinase/phosphorylase